MQKSDKVEPIHTNKQIAKKAKVSHDTVHKVEKILELGDEDPEAKKENNSHIIVDVFWIVRYFLIAIIST